MAKSPTGSRPTPRVATGQGTNSWNTGGGSYSAKSGTKPPTGSRPVPRVASNTPKSATKPGAVKRSIKHTSMPKNRVTGIKGKNSSGNM